MNSFSTRLESAPGQILIGPFQTVIVAIETLSGRDLARTVSRKCRRVIVPGTKLVPMLAMKRSLHFGACELQIKILIGPYVRSSILGTRKFSCRALFTCVN